MRIVIAYDGSDAAKAAIEELRRSGMPRVADAMIVSVAETLLQTPVSAAFFDGVMSHRVAGTLIQTQAEAVRAAEEASALADEGSRRVLAEFPHWGVYPEPVVGTPALTVLARARDWQADVLVVGSHGRTALGRFLLGSVSKQVATESRCSVRVARHVVARGDTPVRIIVGVDGSPGAEATIHSVVSRAWPTGTEVRLVHADDTIRPLGTVGLLPTAQAWVKESNDDQMAKASEMLERAANTLATAGVRVCRRVIKGSPQAILKDEARTWGSDCIYVGAQGNTLPEQHRLGRVATALVTTAPCTVEIARR
jgi:nucleotide-binding universal stress UspA family protein